MLDKFRISVTWVAKIMTSWLNDPYIIYAVTAEVTELIKRKNFKKSAVYFQPDDNHETRIAKRKKILKYRFKHDLKLTFIFRFLP